MKKNTLTQEGRPTMNIDLMPQSWKDDYMPLSDHSSMEECDSLPIKQPLDANQIEDYDNMSEVPVYDYLGREIGLKSVPRRSKKKS